MNYKRKIFLYGIIPNIITTTLIYLYSYFVSEIDTQQFIYGGSLLAITFSILQVVAAPLLINFLFNKTSKKLDQFYTNPGDEKSRTLLLEEINGVAFKTGFLTGAFYIAADIVLFLLFRKANIKLSDCIKCFDVWLYGAYFAGLLTYFYNKKISYKYSIDIINKGVDKKYVMNKKIFGHGIKLKLFLYIILPVIFTNLIMLEIVITSFMPFAHPELRPASFVIKREMICSAIFNSIILLSISFAFFISFHKRTKDTLAHLEKLNNAEIFDIEPITTDLQDELSYNNFLSNELFAHFKNILVTSSNIGSEINSLSDKLTQISNETISTSIEQSSGTNEIVSTMEDTIKLSHIVEEKINEVTEYAQNTMKNISVSNEIMEQNNHMMTKIEQANELTIQGIKELYVKINSIREIINIINNITDQTKIIAFNAELEVSQVKAHSENFHNVANEIRHLANYTMDSTQDIKNLIAEIQNEYKKLIESSDSTKEKFQKGKQIASELYEGFEHIMQETKENSLYEDQIKELVKTQVDNFIKIVEDTKEIALGIKNFPESTKTIINTSETLKEKSDHLKSITIFEASASGDAK